MDMSRWEKRTGKYYGDASNLYPIGTKYYEIIGISPSKAIAVKEESQLVKAVYVHKAPFHILNVLSNSIFLILVGIIVLIIILAIFRTKKLKINNLIALAGTSGVKFELHPTCYR
jgi:hypothetical protein